MVLPNPSIFKIYRIHCILKVFTSSTNKRIFIDDRRFLYFTFAREYGHWTVDISGDEARSRYISSNVGQTVKFVCCGERKR